MASLLDIGPLTKSVSVNGVELTVRGISGEMLFHLLDTFPELRKIMSTANIAVDPELLMKQAPGAVAAVIAAATGSPGDKKAEKVAGELGVAVQAEIIFAAWDLTFPKGIASFIEALEAVTVQLGAIEYGKAPGTPSPEPSNNSSQAAIQQKTSGDTRPE